MTLPVRGARLRAIEELRRLKHRAQREPHRALEIDGGRPCPKARQEAIVLGHGERPPEDPAAHTIHEPRRARRHAVRRRPVVAADERAHRRRVDGRALRVERGDGLVARDAHVGGLLPLRSVVEIGHRNVGRQLGERRALGGKEIVERVEVLVVAEASERRRSDSRRALVGRRALVTAASGDRAQQHEHDQRQR
jgi:hypothetical protein